MDVCMNVMYVMYICMYRLANFVDQLWIALARTSTGQHIFSMYVCMYVFMYAGMYNTVLQFRIKTHKPSAFFGSDRRGDDHNTLLNALM